MDLQSKPAKATKAVGFRKLLFFWFDANHAFGNCLIVGFALALLCLAVGLMKYRDDALARDEYAKAQLVPGRPIAQLPLKILERIQECPDENSEWRKSTSIIPRRDGGSKWLMYSEYTTVAYIEAENSTSGPLTIKRIIVVGT